MQAEMLCDGANVNTQTPPLQTISDFTLMIRTSFTAAYANIIHGQKCKQLAAQHNLRSHHSALSSRRHHNLLWHQTQQCEKMLMTMHFSYALYVHMLTVHTNQKINPVKNRSCCMAEGSNTG
jgi:hypothetical protein|mmetsp:Transcript_68557/g.109638  ORF Transcript_68557/g.109638 Transcript_68557/m.109638 type:complete len:122 (-) Transcript_68557:399-764(-)